MIIINAKIVPKQEPNNILKNCFIFIFYFVIDTKIVVIIELL